MISNLLGIEMPDKKRLLKSLDINFVFLVNKGANQKQSSSNLLPMPLVILTREPLASSRRCL